MPLLIPLGEILFWVGALIFCYLVVYIARALFGTAAGAVGWIPFIGKVVERSLHSIEHKIVATMSRAAETVDAKIGASFHQLARLVDWIGRELHSHATQLAMLAATMLTGGWSLAVQQALARLAQLVHALDHTRGAVVTRVIHVEKRLQHGIGEDVLPRLRTLDREIGRVLGRDLPRIRARERVLERDVSHLWKWVRTHGAQVGTLAFAGAVGWALARLGAGWVRCSNVKRLGRRACGMDSSLLESLLADTLLIAGTLSLVEFAEEMIGVTATAVRPISTFWRAS